MTEYIERSAALAAVCVGCHLYDEGSPCGCAEKEEILAIPVSDVTEVVYGKWENTPIEKDIFRTIRCSKCGEQALFEFKVNAFGDKELYRFPSNYCPNCGAKMDGERSNENAE